MIRDWSLNLHPLREQFVIISDRMMFIGLYGQPLLLYTGSSSIIVSAVRELIKAATKMYKDKDVLPKCPISWKNMNCLCDRPDECCATLEEEKKYLRHPVEETLRNMLYELVGLLNGDP
ncbi:hypothetical protein OUZ56_011777 [Daphnia magna]|uniref:Uncharacterized protein n=1 Tax=Daphnia magna TaxID=35525 RepID=A0ABQ9Z191_9CRUS|nr:hypothetical protein OUZ56_011777 [Daphnia magna]